jgi:hypothetical protein
VRDWWIYTHDPTWRPLSGPTAYDGRCLRCTSRCSLCNSCNAKSAFVPLLPSSVAPAADLVSRRLVPGFSFVAFPRGEQWDSYMPGGSGWHIRPTSRFRGCACSVRVYNSSAPGSLHANAAFCRGSYSVDNLVQEQGRTFAVFIFYLDANR